MAPRNKGRQVFNEASSLQILGHVAAQTLKRPMASDGGILLAFTAGSAQLGFDLNHKRMNEHMSENCVWDEKDFEFMSWRDNRVHSIAFSPENHELALDIDHITKWF